MASESAGSAKRVLRSVAHIKEVIELMEETGEICLIYLVPDS